MALLRRARGSPDCGPNFEEGVMRLPPPSAWWLATLLAVALPSAPTLAADAEYDLVLRNGKVVDGTGNPWFLGDVAVRGDRVVAVGRVVGTAKRVIDARGLVVA